MANGEERVKFLQSVAPGRLSVHHWMAILSRTCRHTNRIHWIKTKQSKTTTKWIIGLKGMVKKNDLFRAIYLFFLSSGVQITTWDYCNLHVTRHLTKLGMFGHKMQQAALAPLSAENTLGSSSASVHHEAHRVAGRGGGGVALLDVPEGPWELWLALAGGHVRSQQQC